MPLTPEQEKFVKELYERHKPPNMTFLEVRVLYEQFLKRCEEVGVDPATIDFEYEVDWSLRYHENLVNLEKKIIGLIPTPPELEELSYYKRRVEELEKQIEKLRDTVHIEEIEKLKDEIKKWKERYEKAKKTIEEVKATPGLTEEDVRKIFKETIKEVTLPLGELLKAIMNRIRELEKKVAQPTVTIERAEVLTPKIPPRTPSIVKKYDVLTKEMYETDVDFEFRVNQLATLAGFSISRIFFETSDKTRSAIGYPTFFELAKKIYKHGSERGILTPAHLNVIGFTPEEIKKLMDD
jgi:polyhydroxyalkanoate synthesis regulator phasin